MPRLYELPFLSFSIAELAEEVRRERFPEITEIPSICFGKMKRLAFCQINAEPKPLVVISSLLNHGTTPRVLIKCILTHEFLHLLIPSREVDGKMSAHPPEFFERERELCPNMSAAWVWFFYTFGTDLVRCKEKEQTTIKNWRRHFKDRNFMPMEDALEFCSTCEEKENAGCF